MKECNVSIM